MLKRLMVRVLRDSDGAPGGPPASDPPAADPPAADPAPSDLPAADPPAGDVDDGTPKTVPLKALVNTQDKLREAREELAYLRGMQAAQPQPAAAQPQAAATHSGPPVEPNIDDFDDDYAAFQRADRQYIVDLARYEARQEFEQGQHQRSQQETAQAQLQTFNGRLAKAAELDPELTHIASTFHLPGPGHIPLNEVMQGAIMESDVGPQLLRHFANNRNEASRLANLSPASALREIGRIEATIINKPTPPVKHVTSAPEPVKPVGGGGSVEIDEDKLPMSEYMARERAKKQALRQNPQRR